MAPEVRIVAEGLIPCVVTGFFLTILIETAVLVATLSPIHSLRRKFLCGVFLTATTYPFVGFVFPLIAPPSTAAYYWISEIFAPGLECLVFWALFHRGKGLARAVIVRDLGAIVLANLCSFGIGEVLKDCGLLVFRP